MLGKKAGLSKRLEPRQPSLGRPCPFCEIAAGRQPAKFAYRDTEISIFTPLNPVTPGHLLVVPHLHVEDFTTDVSTSALAMMVASFWAGKMGPVNLITSKGVEATQSVFHLHIHLVPRRKGDGLSLPWTGQH
jgi:histidine triad (HIT) family protein